MSSLPGPSSPGKRLSELLQEQQEPFLLDLFILENRCSRKAVFSESGRSCWPVGAWKTLWSLAVHRLNGQRRKQLLRSFVRAHHPRQSPGRGREIEVHLDGQRSHGWEDPEKNQRLSPVSVLELCCNDATPELDDHVLKKAEEESNSADDAPERNSESSENPMEGDSSVPCLEEERKEICRGMDPESLDSLRAKRFTRTWVFTARASTPGALVENYAFSPFVKEMGDEIAHAQLENLVEELLGDLISL